MVLVLSRASMACSRGKPMSINWQQDQEGAGGEEPRHLGAQDLPLSPPQAGDEGT